MEHIMKYISLIACLFVCAAHIVHGMEKTPEEIIRLSELCVTAINNFNHTELKKALDEGADVNYKNSDGKSLFYLACQIPNNINQLVELITHPSINLNSLDSGGNTPLHIACRLGLTPTVKTMLGKDSQMAKLCNNVKTTPLLAAILSQQKDCVETILSYDISTINHHNNHGDVPLIEARGQVDIIKLLIEYGANINIHNYEGNTLLHLQCECWNLDFDMIKLLIENGAHPTIQNNNQGTPLIRIFSVNRDDDNRLDSFYSFCAENPAVADILICQKDENGNSQLHLCTAIANINEPKFEQYLQFLTDYDLSIHSRNKDGKRAIDLACEEYHALHHQYMAKKTDQLKGMLTIQERIMHAFLRHISPHTPCALFKHTFKQQNTHGYEFPRELVTHIMYDYYALNIETIVAKKYKCDHKYYDDFIENKHEIRQNLLKEPEPRLLWSAE
jgi:ankyrin repeat protein